MAYRKTSRRPTGRRSYSNARRATRSTYKRGARGSGNRSRSSSRVQRGAQTIRIVIENSGSNPVARPAGEGTVTKAVRKAKH